MHQYIEKFSSKIVKNTDFKDTNIIDHIKLFLNTKLTRKQLARNIKNKIFLLFKVMARINSVEDTIKVYCNIIIEKESLVFDLKKKKLHISLLKIILLYCIYIYIQYSLYIQYMIHLKLMFINNLYFP